MTTLAWTLVHFLWQGAIIGLVAWLTLRARLSAPARYAAGVIALAAFATAPVVTLMVTSRPPAGTPPAIAALVPASSAATTEPRAASSTGLVTSAPGTDAFGAIQGRQAIEAYLPYVLLIWSVGVAAMSARLAVRWWLARRLARRGRAMAAADLQAMATRLAGRLALDRVVRLLQSSDVVVPVVVGWLRPVVILPTAAIAGLPPSHIEALLAHELAHVRRHDYLVNLLQSMVETVLFYHPAVWWVSREVRTAREQCCDDLAVAVCDRLEYVTALTNLAALATHPRIALAATDGSLVARVRRLLGDAPRDQGQTTGWAAAVVGVLIVGAVPAGLALTPPQTPATPAVPVVTTIREVSKPVPTVVEVPATPAAELVEVRQAPVETTRFVEVPIVVRETPVSKQALEVEVRLKMLEAELAQIHEKQLDLQRTKVTQETDDRISALKLQLERQRMEVERVQRSFAVGGASPTDVKQLEIMLAEAEQQLAQATKEKSLRMADFELQIIQAKMQREYEMTRADYEKAAAMREKLETQAAQEKRTKAEQIEAQLSKAELEKEVVRKITFVAPRKVSVLVNGTPRPWLVPSPTPYTSNGPAVYLHLEAASAKATVADGRIISGLKFLSWREGDACRVMVLAMVPRIGEKNVFTTDAKLTELVDFATFLVSPGKDVAVPALDAAGRGPISLRVE
jgi:beta-lactamase regulating signal transducer with metallopeptidase domain